MNPPNGYFEDVLSFPNWGNGTVTHVNCTGGIQFAKVEGKNGRLSPIRVDEEVCRSGEISESSAQKVLSECGAIALQIEQLTSFGSVVSATHVPIIPGRKDHTRSPADLWANASRNEHPRDSDNFVDTQEFGRQLDQAPPENSAMGRLAVSLQNADLAMSQLIGAHSEALFRALESYHVGQVTFPSIEDAFSTHSLGLCTALGAARDHFAALIAARLSMSSKVDDMTKLLRKAGQTALNDPLLRLMLNDGLLRKAENGFATFGWLEELRLLRRQFVHGIPYGYKSQEKFGVVEIRNFDLGLHYYRRILDAKGVQADDMLLELGGIYQQASTFFLKAIDLCGYNQNVLTLTDDDIISIEVRKS